MNLDYEFGGFESGYWRFVVLMRTTLPDALGSQ